MISESAQNAGNSIALNAAAVIDNNWELTATFDHLRDSKLESEALTQTLPLLLGATSMALNSNQHRINNMVQNRLQGLRGQSSGEATLAAESVWLATFGSWAKQDPRSGAFGFDADSKGLILGADADLSESTRVGLALAYSQSKIDSGSSIAKQRAEVESYQLIGYGQYALNADTQLTFQADLGHNSTDGRRQLQFAGSTAKSSYDGYSAHLGLGLEHLLRLHEQLTFTPSLRLDYSKISADAYREKGAEQLNLNVKKNNAEALILSVGGQFNYALSDATQFSANLGAGYDSINETASITAAYAGAAGQYFRTKGLKIEPWLANAGLGLNHTLANGTELSASYDAQLRSGFTSQGVQLKARWVF